MFKHLKQPMLTFIWQTISSGHKEKITMIFLWDAKVEVTLTVLALQNHLGSSLG